MKSTMLVVVRVISIIAVFHLLASGAIAGRRTIVLETIGGEVRLRFESKRISEGRLGRLEPPIRSTTGASF